MAPQRRERNPGGAPPQRQERGGSGTHPFRRFFARAKVVIKGITIALLFFFVSTTAFFVITGAIGFGPGDDGYIGWFAALLLLNVVFTWVYGQHQRWKSSHWGT